MIQLISECDRSGHTLTMEGDNIRVENIAQLPERLKDKIIENKPRIIEALERDHTAESVGLMIGRSGLLYMWSVSSRSTAYLEYTGSRWIAWRETYRPGSKIATSTKTIAEGNTFDYVLQSLKSYMDFVVRKRDK